MVFGDAVSKFETFVFWTNCLKIYNLVFVYPKLGQMTCVNVIVYNYVVVSIASNLQLAPVPCAI